MKIIHQTTEFSYGDVENIFCICANPARFQRGTKLPYVQELANIYTCFNDNKASNYAKFDCPPLQLSDNL